MASFQQTSIDFLHQRRSHTRPVCRRATERARTPLPVRLVRPSAFQCHTPRSMYREQARAVKGTPARRSHHGPGPFRHREALAAKRPSTTVAVALLVVAGFGSAISQLSLSPTFGSVPPSTVYPTAFGAAIIAASLLRVLNVCVPSTLILSLLPVHASYAPVLNHYVLTQAGSRLGPEYGSLLVASITDVPLVFMTIYVALNSPESFWHKDTRRKAQQSVFALISLGLCVSSRLLALQYVPQIAGHNLLLTRSGLQLCCAMAYAVLCPSWLLLSSFPALLFTFQINPHTYLATPTARLNTTLHHHGYSLLGRQESLTGYIAVLQNDRDQYRVLRCDHSLLGGEFLVTPQRLNDGIVVPEPVFTVFTMLEAVRLMETSLDRPTKAPSTQSALVM